MPLPALIAALLSMRNQSQQAMLDGFFASVPDTAVLRPEVSDRAFAKARDHPHLPALVSLNDLVVRRADEAGLIERWHDLKIESITCQLARLKAWKFGAKTQRMNAEHREISEESFDQVR